MVALTGQKARTDNREGSFQVLDVVGSARPIVELATAVDDPAVVGPALSDAIRRATTPQRGAVVVELPEDVAGDRSSSPDPVPPIPASANGSCGWWIGPD